MKKKKDRYLVIEKSTHEEDFEKIAWVLRAVSVDEIRGAMCCLHSEEGALVATDGKRIHILWGETPAVPHGKWLPLITKGKIMVFLNRDESIPSRFPDWRRLFEKNEGGRELGELSCSRYDIYQTYARVLRAGPEEAALNVTFLQDLSPYEWRFEWDGETRLSATRDGMQAIIMSMRVFN